MGGEVEKVLWNHFKPEHLLASSDDKTVWCFNKEDGSTVFQIHAHDSAITDLTLSCYMPGLLVTASVDDTIKFWDIHDGKPTFLLSRDMHMGSVICARFCLDSPYSLAVGGKRNGFHIIDVAKLLPVIQRFKKRELLMPVRGSESEGTDEPGGDTAVPEGKTAATHLNGSAGQMEEEEEMEVEGEEINGGQDPNPTSSVRTKVPKSLTSKKKKKTSKHKKKHHHH